MIYRQRKQHQPKTCTWTVKLNQEKNIALSFTYIAKTTSPRNCIKNHIHINFMSDINDFKCLDGTYGEQKKRIGFVCSTIEMNWQQSPFVCAVHASKVCLRMTMLVCLCVFFQFPLQHSPVFINGFQLFFDWNVCALSALSEWRVSWLRIDWKPFWLVCRANCIILDCMRLYDMDIILSIHKTATNKQKTKRNKKCSSPFQMG